MNPRPMGPIDTSSQSLMCLLNTSKSETLPETARSLSKKRWFFRYVKRDTLTWRRVRAEKTWYCICINVSLPLKFQQFQCMK